MNIHNNTNMEKKMCLTDEQFSNEKRFGLGKKMASSLLEKGMISEKDYHDISNKLTQKYQPIFG